MSKIRGLMGVLAQKQVDYVTLRLLVPSGELNSAQLRRLAELAEREGRGYVILSMRKGVELPWVKFERSFDTARELELIGLEAGSCGRKVRAVTACAGAARCPFSLADAERMAEALSEKYYGKDLPAKFKISISGCSNCCSNPSINDFGVVAKAEPRINLEKCIRCGVCVRICREKAVEYANGKPEIRRERCINCGWCIENCPSGAIAAEKTGFAVLIGGKGGKHPRLAAEFMSLASEKEVFQLLEKTLVYFREFNKGTERFADVLGRLGVEHFSDYVLKGNKEVEGKEDKAVEEAKHGCG